MSVQFKVFASPSAQNEDKCLFERIVDVDGSYFDYGTTIDGLFGLFGANAVISVNVFKS